MARINTMRNLEMLTYRQVRFLMTGCNSGILRPEGNRLYDFYLKHEDQVINLFLEDKQNYGKRPFYFWFNKDSLWSTDIQKENYLLDHKLLKTFE